MRNYFWVILFSLLFFGMNIQAINSDGFYKPSGLAGSWSFTIDTNCSGDPYTVSAELYPDGTFTSTWDYNGTWKVDTSKKQVTLRDPKHHATFLGTYDDDLQTVTGTSQIDIYKGCFHLNRTGEEN